MGYAIVAVAGLCSQPICLDLTMVNQSKTVQTQQYVKRKHNLILGKCDSRNLCFSNSKGDLPGGQYLLLEIHEELSQYIVN